MTESYLSWLKNDGKVIHKVIHNPPGPSGKLAGIVKNAIGRDAGSSFCTGCHGGETNHLMAYVDNFLVHVYTVNSDRDGAVFADLVREVKTLGLRCEEWVETAFGRRLHVRFEMVG
jgi:hypothetical protein